MENKKVGIITHYYRSTNYGGVLQAYALCMFLRQRGISAEQIQFDRMAHMGLKNSLKATGSTIKRALKFVVYRDAAVKIHQRNRAFIAFRNAIPHSDKVYTQKNLKSLANQYALFITGSDQVWHPNAVCDAYLLDFGVKGVKKISYAASVAKGNLSAEQKERYRKAFADYCAISVREKETVPLIQEISPVPVEWVLDPVFLLEKKQWCKLMDVPQNEKEPYLLCYFLGDDLRERRLAEQFAAAHHLKIKTLPFLQNKYRACDRNFGDEALSTVTPQRFLGLIYSASVVFTDSFHAMAFSIIFGKEFFVFERTARVASSSMESRISTLAALFSLEDRYCNSDEKCKIEYLNGIKSNVAMPFKNDFEKSRKRSVEFLMEHVRASLGDEKKEDVRP